MSNNQREMRLFGDVKRSEEVPLSVVLKCQSARDALRLTVQWSGLKHAYIAESIGMRPAQFSKILSGIGHLDEDKRQELMDVCGNEAMLQWEAYTRGYLLQRRDPSSLTDSEKAAYFDRWMAEQRDNERAA